MDNSKILFRNKVKSKFTLQIPKAPTNNKSKEVVTLTYISPISLPIPVKTPKKVNEISKFFKQTDSLQKKSYVQVFSKPQKFNIMMNTLKIKEIFPKLQNYKIDQVQKIINGGKGKPKP